MQGRVAEILIENFRSLMITSCCTRCGEGSKPRTDGQFVVHGVEKIVSKPRSDCEECKDSHT